MAKVVILGLENHISAACRADKIRKRRVERGKKKASVKEATAVEVVKPVSPVIQCVQQPPSAALNSVRAMTSAATHSNPPAGYTFHPDCFTDVTGIFWKNPLRQKILVCKTGIVIRKPAACSRET